MRKVERVVETTKNSGSNMNLALPFEQAMQRIARPHGDSVMLVRVKLRHQLTLLLMIAAALVALASVMPSQEDELLVADSSLAPLRKMAHLED